MPGSALAYAFLDQFDHALPIWGIQRDISSEDRSLLFSHFATAFNALRDDVLRR